MEHLNKSGPEWVHKILLRLYFLILLMPFGIAAINFAYPHSSNSFAGGSWQQLSFNSVRNGENSLTLETVLPKNLSEHISLLVYSQEQDLKISIGGITKGEYCGTERNERGQYAVDGWYQISLSGADSGRVLTVEITAAPGKAVDFIRPVYMGDRTTIGYHLLMLYACPVGFGLLMFLIGIFMLFYSLLAWEKGSRPFHCIGAYMIFGGMYFFFSSEIRQIYLSDLYRAQNMSLICLILLQIPLMLYAEEIVKVRFRGITVFWERMDMAVLLLMGILIATGATDIRHIFLPVGMLYLIQWGSCMLILRYREGEEEINPLCKDAFWGFTALFAGELYEVCARYVMHVDSGGMGAAVGALIFSGIGILSFRRWLRMVTARERQELIRNEEKDQFLAEMSHSIRTPANAVLGMDMMILRKSRDHEITDYASDIENACQSLLSIIDDILDFSKIGSGDIELQQGGYHMTSLVNDCHNMIMIKAAEKGLRFRVVNNPRMPDQLYGDEIRIRQIMINLLTNAVKYTLRGEVTLGIDYQEVDSRHLILIITVSDTGIGIRQEDIPHLFESYRRFDEKANFRIEGTGLGLSIVKFLVELMGGKIEVRSVYGEGSEFSVQIPQRILGNSKMGDLGAVLENGMERKNHQTAWFRAPKARVLIVDDVPMNLKVLAALLDETGMQVDLAVSGPECLMMTAKKKYQLIFMDHMMPGMDGEETFRRMKQMSENQNETTPVVMLTANAILGAKEAYLQEGFCSYLAKPVTEAALRDVCVKYLPEEMVSWDKNAEEENTGEDNNQEHSFQPGEAQNSEGTDQIAALDEFLNTEAGIAYCVDDRDLYLEILGEYVHPDREQQIQNAFAQEDWKNYQVGVHSLKSTSRTIGAAKLSEMSLALEDAAKAGDIGYIRVHHEETMKMYGKLKARIRENLQAE